MKCTQENVYMPNHEQIQILTIGSIMKFRAEHLDNSMTGSQVVTHRDIGRPPFWGPYGPPQVRTEETIYYRFT
jgi:hypothetical protein